MYILKSLQNARRYPALLERTTPIGLPMRPDAVTLNGCSFFGYHGDMSAFLPETWPGSEVSPRGYSGLRSVQACCVGGTAWLVGAVRHLSRSDSH